MTQVSHFTTINKARWYNTIYVSMYTYVAHDDSQLPDIFQQNAIFCLLIAAKTFTPFVSTDCFATVKVFWQIFAHEYYESL